MIHSTDTPVERYIFSASTSVLVSYISYAVTSSVFLLPSENTFVFVHLRAVGCSFSTRRNKSYTVHNVTAQRRFY